jgi:type I restriction enzyme S subunit
MQLENGYKQIEGGVIPEDWELSTVGREYDIQLGKMVDAEKNTGVLKPYLGNRAVQWNSIDVSNLPMVAMSKSDLKKYRLNDGDLLVCEGGDVGRSALWTSPLKECYYQKALHRLSARNGFSSTLMIAFLQKWSTEGRLTNFVTQTSIAHLPKDKFVTMPLPLPPLPEQRAIAEALGDVDSLIASLDALITKKRQIKQGTMQQLLTGKNRLPGFSGEWEETTLGELATFLSGGTPSRSNEDYWTGDIPWISASSLRCFEIWRSDSNVTEEAVAAGSKMAPVSSTLLLVRGSALHKEILCGLVTKPVCFNQDVKALVPQSQVVPIFLTTMIKGRAEELLKLVSSAGNTAGVLDTKLLKAFEVNLPSLSEQSAIAEVLSDMDAEITALEAKRDKTKLIKQGMMQQLLTGKTRLKGIA